MTQGLLESDLGTHLGEARLELVGGDVVAVLEAVVDRLGDDFGLVAVDAAGCELLGASVSNIRGAALGQ